MFNTVYLSYSSQSGFSTGWSVGLSPQMGLPISTNFFSVGANYNISHDSWSGNVSAWQVDQNGWTFNPSVSLMVFPEHTTNFVRGQGFRSNDNVLSRFVAANNHKGALDYWGFKGKYNPNAKPPRYVKGTKDYFGFTQENGDINYGNLAFDSYSKLNATYYKELYHHNKIAQGGSFERNNIKGNELYPEEMLGFINQYKNHGFYSDIPLSDIESQISFYQIGCGIIPGDYNYYQFNLTNRIIYSIPRLW